MVIKSRYFALLAAGVFVAGAFLLSSDETPPLDTSRGRHVYDVPSGLPMDGGSFNGGLQTPSLGVLSQDTVEEDTLQSLIVDFVESHRLTEEEEAGEGAFLDEMNEYPFHCVGLYGGELYALDPTEFEEQGHECGPNGAKGLYNNDHAMQAFLLTAEYNLSRKRFSKHIKGRERSERIVLLEGFDDHYRGLIGNELQAWRTDSPEGKELELLISLEDGVQHRSYSKKGYPRKFVPGFY